MHKQRYVVKKNKAVLNLGKKSSLSVNKFDL